MKIKYILYTFMLFLFLNSGSTGTVFSADLSIPTMELITRADFSGSVPEITSRGKVVIDLTGGYKFGGNLSLGFDSSDLSYSSADISDYDNSSSDLANYLSNQTYLTFQAAEITLRDVLAGGTAITYFIGKTNVLCSGDDFPRIFGSYPIATRYRGYLYFPSNEFDGIHRINGTGMKIATTWGSDNNLTSFYLYKDGYLPDTYFSSDIRTMFNFNSLKIESFAGSTFPYGSAGLFRGGFLLHYRSGDIGEFLAQIGVPQWDPSASFEIDNLFFLFEPRINFNMFSIILTLFWHPGYYLQQQTVDTGTSNVHLNFMFGDLSKSPLAGGIESSVTFDSNSADSQFNIVATPYVSAITAGVIWNFMVNINLFPFTLNDMFEGIIGIKAEF